MNERDMLEVIQSLAAEERRMRQSPDPDPAELDRLRKQREELLGELRRVRAENSGSIDLRGAVDTAAATDPLAS